MQPIDTRFLTAINAQNTVLHELGQVFRTVFTEKFGEGLDILLNPGGWDYRGFMIRWPDAQGALPEKYPYYLKIQYSSPIIVSFEDRLAGDRVIDTLDLVSTFALTLDEYNRYQLWIDFATKMVQQVSN